MSSKNKLSAKRYSSGENRRNFYDATCGRDLKSTNTTFMLITFTSIVEKEIAREKAKIVSYRFAVTRPPADILLIKLCEAVVGY